MSNLNTVLADLAEQFSEIYYLNLIKTGKEAEVHLVKVDGEFCALKIYRQNQKFSSRKNYLVMAQVADARTARAIKKGSIAGLKAMGNIWVNREAEVLGDLFNMKSLVPELYLAGNGYLLMEYLGDRYPAPRLTDINLTLQQMQTALTDVYNTIKSLLNLGYVHGDLSAYNILWFNEHAYVIDFPQVLDIRTNSNAGNRFEIDLENLRRHFEPLLKDIATSSLKELREIYEQS